MTAASPRSGGALRRLLVTLGGGVASGVLLAAALPPSPAGLLGFIAFVPVLVAVEGAGIVFALAGGLVAAASGALVAESGLFVVWAVVTRRRETSEPGAHSVRS